MFFNKLLGEVSKDGEILNLIKEQLGGDFEVNAQDGNKQTPLHLYQELLSICS